MPDAIQELRERLAELSDLAAAGSLLGWDQQTMMPERGADRRAEQLGTLGKLLHERFTDPAIGRLLDAAEADGLTPEVAASADDDPRAIDAALVRVTRRDWEKARRVPSELAAKIARAGALGHAAWVEARERSDFAAFLPALRRNVELKLRYVECFDGFDDPYDVLLDDYEEGMTSAEVDALFGELRAALVPLIAAIAERADAVDDSLLRGDFPVERQRALVRSVLERLGWSSDGWRLDEAAHPFATTIGGPGDVRLTTRYDPGYVGMALYGAIHELGHGLYESQIDPALARTPLGEGVSLGVHESQSRLWENIVGRGRPFAGWLHGRLVESFPERFTDVDADAFFRAVNRVSPSLIRVEADEATYGLHIILRFELERAMIAGTVRLEDLPQEWNARMREYLGVEVPDDARGVLQDVHWSGGDIGYFATYALGNLIAAQLWERARADLPDLDDALAAGDGAPLRGWLREHVHRFGRRLPPRDLVQRATGAPIRVEPFINYLNGKLRPIYGL